jgi:transcriptional regulator GlxA family with amidase domain
VPAPALEVFRLLPGLLVHQRVLPLGGVGGLPRRFATLARQLAQAADEDLPRVYGHLHQFLIDLHRLARGGPHHIALRQAGDLVAEDPLRPPSTAMLAARVGLGHHVFRKAFAQHYGCGPQVYALRLRLRLAQGLLATTNETVASIGARCGWKDPLQFSAVFRRHAGLSPRAWRHREAQGG